MTRDAASGPVDPAVPYLYTGTLKPTPVKITQTVDDFDNNSFTGGKWGKGTIVESNQQFNVFGDFHLPTHSIYDSFVFGGPSEQNVMPLEQNDPGMAGGPGPPRGQRHQYGHPGGQR